MTVGSHLVLSEPGGASAHGIKVAWMTAVFLIPALALPLPLYAQAYGNLFVPALLLLFGLGVILHKAKSAGLDQTSAESGQSLHGDHIVTATMITPAGRS
jgi:hypothetical protein